MLKILNLKNTLVAIPYFYRPTMQVVSKMKFRRSIFLIISFLCITAFVVAQPDSSQNKISADTNIVVKDTLPSSLYITSISIYGNKKTKSFIIERELPFKQGDYVTPAQLQKYLVTAREQLINTSLFLDVSVYIENRFEQFVFITVYVKERLYIFPLPYFRYIDPNFNTWWVTNNHSLKRINYGIKFLHTNISGRNDKFTAWLITGYSQQIAFKYERPYFDKKLKNGFTLYFNYSYQRELNYTTDSSKQEFFRPDSLFFVRRGIRAEASYVYRPGLRVRHFFRIGYSHEKIADTIIALNHDYFSNGSTEASFPYIGYTFQYLHADYNAYPTKGFLSETSILHRGIGSDMNLTQLQTINSYTFPVLPKTQIQLKEGAVLNLPFNQPFYNKTMFGYGNGNMFMRGYEYYVIDGVAGIIGRLTLQNEILNFKVKMAGGIKNETYFPFKFYAKLFTDVGYAYDKDPGNSILNNRLLHCWGLGIDMVTAYDFVLKIDYSFNQLGGNGLFIHVRSDF